MDLKNKRRILASVATLVIVALATIAVAANYFPAKSPIGTRIDSTALSSSLGSVSAFASSSSITTKTTTSGFSIVGSNCKGNCTIDVPWTSIYHMCRNFTDLTTDSNAVLLVKVTSETAVLADGIPVTEYNITTIKDVLGNTELQPGMEVPVLQVGGTADGVTMNIKGEQPLVVGGTYVLFLSAPGGITTPVNQGNGAVTSSESTTVINGTTITFRNSATISLRHSADDPLAQYVLPADDGVSQITVGCPQGIFQVQGGKVYSLDNANPQDDAWLPLKVSGMPLAQFIQEVQSAATTPTA
jgi:hypothetical protein